MMAQTKIEWTDKVWNPVTGCSKVSNGCRNCYAENFANRFWKDRKFTDVICHEDKINIPFGWVKPRKIFVNSMSDLFHPSVPSEFIDKIFAAMYLNKQHTFIVLTKRPKRMLEYFSSEHRAIEISKEVMALDQWFSIELPLKNVWIGVSVEDQITADERIPLLLRVPAAVRFISAEPLLSGIVLASNYLDKARYFECGTLDWVIAGGESGRNARACHPDWIRSLRDQCKEANVPFFFKQWGEWMPFDNYIKYLSPCKTKMKLAIDLNHVKTGKKKAGRLLDGIEHNEFPKI